ncbi:MAG: invasion associated locus B family protein [Rhodobacteraceae bacterium]|nr:invasion associated locus B family protein [Paracoccaceae bacterium]
MKPFVKLSALALGVAMAAPSFAQDTSQAGTDQFPIGQEQEIQVGQTYLVEKKGAWEIRCVKVEEGAEPCHIYQLLKNTDGDPVAEISIFHLPGGGAAIAGATAITPLGTLLTAGVKLQIEDEKPKVYPFNWCEGVGCISRMGLTGLEIQKMKKGSVAEFTIVSIAAQDQPVTLKMDLNGFSDAFTAVLVK